MTLEQLFKEIPIHSYCSLEVRDNDGNTVASRDPLHNWCDGAMLTEFEDFAQCDVYDIRSDFECSGLLRIIVTAKDRLVKSRDGWVYIAQSGKRYEIAELKVPNSATTYDIAVLMDYDDEKVGAGDTNFINYFFGINDISDSDLIEICREYVERYEKNF